MKSFYDRIAIVGTHKFVVTMKGTSAHASWKYLLSVMAFAAIEQSLFAVPSSNLRPLLADPMAFHGKRLTLIGLADVVGAEFWLYPNVRAAKKGESAVAISWDLRKGPVYKKFDRHWVKVTGVVDGKSHGPLGAAPCEIWAERVEALPYPPLPDPYIYGVFRNDTPATVDLKFSSPTGYGYTLNISAGGVTDAAAIAKGMITASTRSGKLLAKGNLIPSSGAQRYFDAKNRTYYYRITSGRIELVPPGLAKRW
jgi:hypothetical protein